MSCIDYAKRRKLLPSKCKGVLYAADMKFYQVLFEMVSGLLDVPRIDKSTVMEPSIELPLVFR